MRAFFTILVLALVSSPLFSQKVDSIYFHLYTDSLKKGQYNYINVDGKLSNGRWVPLSGKELQFSCASARFEGNELIIPEDFAEKKVTIRAVLKSNPAVWIEKTIWIKQKPDGPLPTREEIMKGTGSQKTKRKSNR